MGDKARDRLATVVARGKRVSARAVAKTAVQLSGGNEEALSYLLGTAEPTADGLIRAHQCGFYLTDWGGRFHWENPAQRGVSPIGDFHLPKHARRLIRKGELETRVNTDFAAVIDACARAPRKQIDATWLSPRIQELLLELHERGVAHCVSVYRGDELVAGIYGMAMGGAFSAESSFTTVSNASKVAYAHLHFGLREADFTLLDVQEVSSMAASFGAHFVSREVFLRDLTAASVLQRTFPDTELMVAATRTGVGL